jgi:hypothetical protein
MQIDPAIQIEGLQAIVQAGGVIATVATAFAAVAAWRAARAGERQVALAETTRKESIRPEIMVDAVYDKIKGTFRIRNVGRGTARNVSFSANAAELPSTMSHSVVLQSRALREGFVRFHPGDEWRTDWTGLIGLEEKWIENWGDEAIEIQVEYQDIEGEHYVQFHYINPLHVLGTIDIDETTSADRRRQNLEKALLELVQQLKQGQALKVEITDPKEDE